MDDQCWVGADLRAVRFERGPPGRRALSSIKKIRALLESAVGDDQGDAEDENGQKKNQEPEIGPVDLTDLGGLGVLHMNVGVDHSDEG